jgi:hydroxymethylpyrimidine pyrophosphatase-like HAD family hydrolase
MLVIDMDDTFVDRRPYISEENKEMLFLKLRKKEFMLFWHQGS